jgi:peptidyl-prolyl cis-trans isomerase A (cyclophilin A)/peptidyl-prolyl cis-trans isomerase B (cyclophilin B)
MHITRLTLLGLALGGLILAAWLSGCGGSSAAPTADAAAASSPTESDDSKPTVTPASATAPIAPKIKPPVDPVVVVHTTAGDFQVQLFAEKSPATVDNFLRNYASRGFYDETIFHHVEPGSMLIGGGYTAELEAKPARTPIFNESRNGLSNRRGSVAMIRDPESPHSATTQFYINLADNPELDYKTTETDEILGYCVFGEVIAGMDVVERIAATPTSAEGEFARVPTPRVAIRSVERIR